jgi:hypothetical protein
MPRDLFQECENSLEADLAEIEGSLRFSQSSFRLLSKSEAMLQAVSANADLREVMIELRNARIGDLSLTYRSTFIQIWFSFEQFVRRLVVTYLDEFASRKSDFETLEKYGLARRNLQYTGTALQHIIENRRGLAINFFSLATNAATSVPGSAKVDLNSATFSLFLSGPSPDGLKESFRRIGIDLNWDDLGRSAEVQRATRSQGVRATAKHAEEFLRDAARRRHNIVHKTDNIEQITEAEVMDALSTFRAMGRALLDTVKRDCERKCR